MHPANGVDIDEADGEFRGLLLRATYTAEHETGIARLHRDLGVPQGFGFEARTAPADTARDRRLCSRHDGLAEEAFWIERPLRSDPRRSRTRRITSTAPYAALLLGRDHDHSDPDRVHATVTARSRRYSPDRPVAGAWDDQNCMIVGYGPQGLAHIAALCDAHAAGDLVLWYVRPADTPFRRTGLYIARGSRIPPETARRVAAADRERHALESAAQATGIADRIAEANARRGRGFALPYGYHALDPAWIPTGRRTAHPVWFHLVPIERTARPGWYAVEEIDAWLAGRGPIPEKQAD